MNFGPIDLQACEIFAIRSGKIHEIEAMGYLLPYNAKTGSEWEREPKTENRSLAPIRKQRGWARDDSATHGRPAAK